MRKLLTLKKAAAVFAIAGLLMVPTARALTEWGPDRPTFTWANPADHITFNSITDNPVAGDERMFYTANHVGVSDFSHSLPVSDGQEVTLRAYVHNNASADLNLVAHNTRIKMTVPGGEATNQTSVSTISADNASPTSVFDTVHLTSDKAFTLEYEAGSAKLFNNVFTAGTGLSDSIVSDSGALVGYDKMDGNLPGCNQFSAWVTIRVKVRVKQPPQPSFSCDAFNITSDVNRTVKVSEFKTSAANGAVLKNAVVDWGDNSAKLTDANIIGKTHQYDKDGTFTITATAHFTVNGQDQTASGPACQKQVTFSSTTPPKVTPPPTTPPAAGPTQLVNTGPGEVASLFGLTTVLGAVAHRWNTARRLTQE